MRLPGALGSARLLPNSGFTVSGAPPRLTAKTRGALTRAQPIRVCSCPTGAAARASEVPGESRPPLGVCVQMLVPLQPALGTPHRQSQGVSLRCHLEKVSGGDVVRPPHRHLGLKAPLAVGTHWQVGLDSPVTWAGSWALQGGECGGCPTPTPSCDHSYFPCTARGPPWRTWDSRKSQGPPFPALPSDLVPLGPSEIFVLGCHPGNPCGLRCPRAWVPAVSGSRLPRCPSPCACPLSTPAQGRVVRRVTAPSEGGPGGLRARRWSPAQPPAWPPPFATQRVWPEAPQSGPHPRFVQAGVQEAPGETWREDGVPSCRPAPLRTPHSLRAALEGDACVTPPLGG